MLASGVGDDYRPAHLHFQINGRQGHKSLVTQMYFSGDKDLGNADPCEWCSSGKSDLVTKPKRICRLNKKKKRFCYDSIEFNITLAKGRGFHTSPIMDDNDNNVC